MAPEVGGKALKDAEKFNKKKCLGLLSPLHDIPDLGLIDGSW